MEQGEGKGANWGTIVDKNIRIGIELNGMDKREKIEKKIERDI